MDERKISSLMTLDQSVAFDCVQHSLLLQKFAVYNLDSYLVYRSQFVSIGRSHSRMAAMDRGVPQGSVLGPLLYTIFTNEMSESVINPNCPNTVHNNHVDLFCQNCTDCGKVTQYADNATYQTSSKLRQNNQKRLTENLKNLGDFLNANKLTINKDKTHLLKIMIKLKRGRTPGNPP